MEDRVSSKDGSVSISSSPDFAQAYIFIQTFGSLLKLPRITLSDFENFFVQGGPATDNQMVFVHWRLLNTTHRMAQVDWERSAVKCARRLGLCNETVSYFTLSAQVRLKLFRLCCDEQFDYNVSFKSQLTREMMGGPFSKPLLGYDSYGQRLWLLRDSSFGIRLYGESQYDVVPPKLAKWVEVARSLERLAEYTARLESTRGDCLQAEVHDSYPTVEKNRAKPKLQIASKKSKTNPPVWEGDHSIEGCIKCKKDSHHSQMLLCDECDRECHTYCQYPRLWRVPRGNWSCPICKEGHLIQELKKVYVEISMGKSHHEKLLEKKEKSIARLQRTGLLVKNIILEEEDISRKSRRSRKEINYAELNDVQLPPLGLRDFVGCDWISPPVTKRTRTRQEYIHDDYLAPRIRSSGRLFRGPRNRELETNIGEVTVSNKEDEVIDVEDDVVSSTSERLCASVTLQSGSMEPGLPSCYQSNGGYSISHDSPSNDSDKNSSHTCSTTSSHESNTAIESHTATILSSATPLVGRLPMGLP